MTAIRDRLPADFQAHLDTGCTTLAHCWQVTRTDDVTLGFTDHDLPLTFEGTRFDPSTCAEGSEIQTRTGLAVDNSEISGALLSEGLSESDLAAGLYDGAKVKTWLVNWADVDQRTLLATGTFGTIKRLDGAWQVEVRGLGDELAQTRGRRYGRRCDARLGDARCGVDLSAPHHSTQGTLVKRDGARLTLSGIDGATFGDGRFANGRIRKTGGSTWHDISAHWREGSNTIVTVWTGSTLFLEVGDDVELTVGCDKSWATCRNRFANAPNFRGFPHIPGNDFAMAVAKEDQLHDGSALVVDDD